MKLKIDVDMSEFIEEWGDDSLETELKNDIRYHLVNEIKRSPQYKKLVASSLADIDKTLFNFKDT